MIARSVMALAALMPLAARAHGSHASHVDDDDYYYYNDGGGAWVAFVFVFLFVSCMLCLVWWPSSYSYDSYADTGRCRECDAPLGRGMVVCSACARRPKESRESRASRDEQLLLMGALLGASTCGPKAPAAPKAPPAPPTAPSAPSGPYAPSGCSDATGPGVQFTDDDGHTNVFRKCDGKLEMRSNARGANYPVYVPSVQRMRYQGHTLAIDGLNADGGNSTTVGITDTRILQGLRTLSQQCNVTFEVVPDASAPP